MISKTKKIVFTAVLIALPLFLLLLVEVTLQIFWTPEEVPLVKEVRYDNIDWYEINRAYLQKFFPYNIVYVPEFKPVAFRKEKPNNLFRIICLGGSSMYGTPYLITANIGGILRRQLRALYPDKEFEVINFAATAINSSVVRRFVPELEKFEPDLVLIYMGHNEFYGPDGVGASAAEKALPALTSLKYFFRELRIGSILRTTLRSLSSGPDSGTEINLMREVSAESHVKLESEDTQRVLRNFADNLSAITGFFSKQNIPVIVSEVSSNLDFPPFAYNRMAQETNLEQLQRKFSVSDFTKIKDLLQHDSTNAMLQYLAGQLYMQTNNPDAAFKHLALARDYDLLKFRAPQKINEVIRSTCTDNGIPFVLADGHIRRHSPMGIPGSDLFWEHLHMNYRGYYHIAQLFLNKISELGLLENKPVPFLPAQPDSLYLCWLDLAYADLAVQSLTSRWPFSDYPVQTEVISASPPGLLEIARGVYLRQTVWLDACYKSAEFFEKQGRYDRALTTYRAVLEEYPYNYYTHYLVARLYKDTGDLSRAYRHYNISLNSDADFLQSNLELGLIENNMALFDDAIGHFNHALQLVPAMGYAVVKANIYYGLSAAWANKGDMRKGLEYVNRALEQDPAYRPALQLRQQIEQANEVN